MPGAPSNIEKQLLLQVAEGDEHAFKILFDNAHSKLAGYMMGWTKSTVMTEEAIMSFINEETNAEEVQMVMEEVWGEYEQEELWFNADKREALVQRILSYKAENKIVHRVHFLKTAWFRYAAAAVFC